MLAWLGAVLAVGPACGDDGDADSGAGSGSGSSESASSSDGSSASASSGPTGGSSGTLTGSTSTDPGTTSAVDDTTGPDATAGSDETAIPVVAFGEVLAVIGENCFCHRSTTPQGQLDLRDDAAYASLVSVPSVEAAGVDRVVPGDPDGSYLYLKLLGEQTSVGGSGTRMPQGAPMLPPEDIDLVRYWILGGANP